MVDKFRGQVLSKLSGAPVAGVAVVVTNSISGDVAAAVVTDIYGRYLVEVPDGDYDIAVASLSVSGVQIRGGGTVVMLTAGEDIAYGKACYLTNAGMVKKATSEGEEAEAAAQYMCITADGVADGEVGIFKMGGEVVGVSAGTIGAPVWLGTDGDLIETAGGAIVVPLGIRSASTVLHFRPGPVIVAPHVADLSAIRFQGPIGDMWLDRENYRLYIGGGGSSVTDSSGTYSRSNASCLDLLTGLFTAWAPVLSTANCNLCGDSTWIYVSGATGCNGGVGARPQRVDKIAGSTNDASFVASDFSAVSMVSDGSNIWAGPHVNNAVAPGFQSTYKVNADGSCSATAFVDSFGTTIANGCAPSGFTGNGSLFGACQSALPPGPPYLAHGSFCADATNGHVAQSTYGVYGSHLQIAEGGKMVVVGTFTAINDMSLGSAYAAALGVAILNDSLTAYYPFTVTFTRSGWGGGYNGCAVDPANGDVWIAGESITSVEGDSARKTIFKVTAGGALETTFNPVFSTAGVVEKSYVIDGCLLMGGQSFGTVNGVVLNYFAALRTDTGALYTG